MSDPMQSLSYALEKYPEQVEAVELRELLMETARQNPRRPAFVKLALPDESVKSLRGPADRQQDLLLLVRIPTEVLERSESSIILPNEV